MSGGAFQHQQYRLGEIADEIEDAIYKNNGKDEDEYYTEYSEETVDIFKQTVMMLRRTQIHVQRIDWLLSGDDGEETFHKRLKADLDKLGLNNER